MDNGNGNGTHPVPEAPTPETTLESLEERLYRLEVDLDEEREAAGKVGSFVREAVLKLTGNLRTLDARMVAVEALAAKVEQLAQQVAPLVEQVASLARIVETRLPADPRERLQGGRPAHPRNPDGTLAWEGVTAEIVGRLRTLSIQPKHLAAYLGVSRRTLQRWMANKVEPEGKNMADLLAWLDAVRDNELEDNRRLRNAALKAFEGQNRAKSGGVS